MQAASMLALLLINFACSELHAQTFSLVTGREPITSLDGLWRFHAGDNPQWADPTFNDSQWRLIRSDRAWTLQGYSAQTSYGWYRFRVEVADGSQNIDLLLSEICTGYEIYVDGELLDRAGPVTPKLNPSFAVLPATYELPATKPGPHTFQIALRVWAYHPISSWFGAGILGPGTEVGDRVLIAEHLQQHQSTRALLFVNEYASGLLFAVVGIAILSLSLLRPADREYLWFSIVLLMECGAVILHLLLTLANMVFPLWRFLSLTAEACSLIAALAFFSIVLGAARSIFWRIACLAVAMSPLTAIAIYFQWTGVGVSFAIAAICLLPALLWILVELATRALRKETNAILLLAPAVLFYGNSLVSSIRRILLQLGFSDSFAFDFTLLDRPFPLSLGDVITNIFVLGLLIFLVRRFSLARKEEERLAKEMEAARTVQSLLVPAKPTSTPGFKVESVYFPADQVGGDFFHVMPADDGSLLVVVGDVSGKGFKAAMTVSALIGALRGCTWRNPPDVLAYLNEVLRGDFAGFVTCCVALIRADGKMTIANAGHLPPYMNGAELNVDPGLPLGILTGCDYGKKEFQLSPDTRVVFLSDGVVEATSPTKELFGFDRVRELSNGPPHAIAAAAMRFGQEDDISVISVTRTAVLDGVRA